MTSGVQERPVSEEAFALLGHKIRLDILRAFFDSYAPLGPESLPEVREKRTLSYSELLEATEIEDSGKFNYHLKKLQGVYVEKVSGGYVPTASAIALYEAMVANRPTDPKPVGITIDKRCPNCQSRLRGQYEQEYLTIECPACDLFWGATYRFPKNGIAVREGEGVYEALYDRMMYHVGLARTGQCPSCAGVVDVTIPLERLDGNLTPTVEMSCETCSWLATVDILSALQFEPRVTKTLLEIGIPLTESSSMQATEKILPSVTGQVESEDPFTATIVIPYDDITAKIVIDESLNVHSVCLGQQSRVSD